MSSLNNKINTAVFDNMSKFLKKIYEMEEPLTEVNDVIDELKKFMFEETPTKSKAKSDKPKAPKKEYSVEERCVALTKEGKQCKGKRQINGTHPDVCSIHSTKVPYGKMEENPSNTPDDVLESEVEVESEVLQPVKAEPKPKGKKAKAKVDETPETEGDQEMDEPKPKPKSKSKAKKAISEDIISPENDFEKS